MENKRLRKKLNTWFWWFIYILPIILLFGHILFMIFNKNYANAWDCIALFDDVYNLFDSSFINNGGVLIKLYIMFNDLFEFFGMDFGNYNLSGFMSITFSWFIFFHLVHLVVDCLVFIFDWLHDFFERG